MINVIYEDNHLLVVEKPINIPVQKDSSNDLDLLTILKEYLKKKYNKPGNVYLGLVHRLDRPVGGVMVFAKTSKSASRLSEQIRKGIFKKKYLAIVCGKVKDNDTLQDYLLKDTKTNMVKVDRKGKKSVLNYRKISYKEQLSLVEVELITGRSHQIRVQFSSRGYPLYGDQRYNKDARKGQQIALFSNYITFMHPITNEYIDFKLNMPETKPWKIFKM